MTLNKAITIVKNYHGITREEAIQAISEAEDQIETDDLEKLVSYLCEDGIAL